MSSYRISFPTPVLVLAALIALNGCSIFAPEDEPEQGSIHGVVRSETDSSVIRGAIVILDNEGRTDTTDGSGCYRFESLDVGEYSLTFTKDGFDTEIVDGVVVRDGEGTTVDVSLAPYEEETGELTGHVTSATSGLGVAGAAVIINQLGLSGTTDDSGGYTITSIPCGTFSVTASASGYYPSTNDYVLIVDDQTATADFTLSPELGGEAGALRIILTWGVVPYDLDSHMKTPSVGGRMHHIYYASRGDSADAPYVWLDIDDVDSFGPETITVYAARSGTYYYFVHNYSQSVNQESPDITTSDAVVQIYDANGPRETYHVPTTGSGLYWNVCEIDLTSNVITSRNVIQQTEPGPSSTMSTLPTK